MTGNAKKFIRNTFKIATYCHFLLYMIWWHGDIVMVGKISIDITEYKIFLQKKLNKMEKFLEEHVLLSLLKLHELGNICSISELQDKAS